MSKVIWKYPLLMGVNFTLEMPEGAEVLPRVRLQSGHDLDNQLRERSRDRPAPRAL